MQPRSIFKAETYKMEEVIALLNINRVETYDMLEKGTFPFPAIRLNENRWLLPKKPIDDFLAGLGPTLNMPRKFDVLTGRPRKWFKGDSMHYNFPVPMKLNVAFNAVLNNINAYLAKSEKRRLTKTELIHLALEEFIDRRPEFQDCAEADTIILPEDADINRT